MKTKFYFFIFLLCSLLLNSCNEDLPSYADIETDVKELIVDLDVTSEAVINITDGNGSYKISVDNEDILTATVDENKILLNALQPGTANITITDWARKIQTVKVEVKKLVELELNNKDMTVLVGKVSKTSIYTGNGNYRLSVADESIASAAFNEEGEIEVTGKTPGNTMITVTDSRDKSATINIKCVNELLLETTSLNTITVNEPVEIAILNGNGGYTCKNNGLSSYLSCEIVGDKLSITGLKRYRFNKTVTVSDAEGRSVDVYIEFIDDPYEENPSLRYKVAGSGKYQNLSTAKVGQVVHSPEFNMSRLVAKTTGTFGSGFAVKFDGDLSVGNKENAVLYKVSKGEVDMSVEYPITDCRIDKVDNGWYWVSFLESGYETRSYIITSQTE